MLSPLPPPNLRQALDQLSQENQWRQMQQQTQMQGKVFYKVQGLDMDQRRIRTPELFHVYAAAAAVTAKPKAGFGPKIPVK